MIDFEPTEEQQLIRETVRQFAQNEVRPRSRSADEAGKLPVEVLAAAHDLGLVANALPEKFGGGGERSALTGVLIAEELAWGDLSIALAVLAPSLVGLPVADHGTAAQQEALIPGCLAQPLAAGTLALVEPQYDFDAFRPKTRAHRDADGYRIDGAKCLVPWPDGVLTLLVSAAEGDGAQLFVVARDARGLRVEPDAYMGIRALPCAAVALDGVRVPANARLGGEAGADLRAIVIRGRVALAALAVGVARAAFELARDYAKARHAFGAPIATKQAIAFKLADMAIEIDATRLLVWEAAWQLDQQLETLREATLAITMARRMVLDISDGAVQVFGGHGYVREYLPELLLRNARGFACFEALTLI